MRLSVIIPSYNGAQKLPSLLQALSQQSYQDFETLIVLDGSTDNSEEIIQTCPSKPSTLRMIKRSNGGRATARNTGAKEAKGELLIFFDDDMRPTPRTVAQHLAHHTHYTQSILVGSQLEDKEVLRTDIQHYKAYLSRKWAKPLVQQEGSDLQPLSKDQLFLTAANFSIPKELFWQLEGFDERLTDAEDFDLAVRAFESNIPMYFKQEILAWHDDFINLQAYIRRQRQYKRSHEKLQELKPDLYQNFNHYESQSVGRFKKWVYSLFAQKFWVWSVDQSNWMKLLPKKLRYKIYDIIITGFAVHFPQRII